MIRKIDPDNRRVLKFPAVRPCESISPVILLNSLITLSNEITTFRTNFFPSQKKFSREVIRQMGILQIFFEEIRDHQSYFTKSLILCLSELHFALQKMQFLLQDCTREGSRLYILMKSQFVANQFRVLIGSVGIALDILQFNSLEICSEVKELVELLSQQAQKSKLEVGLTDQCAMERVILILNQFENEFEPEKGLIKRVLDYLGIHSWGDCNNEVKFLEEEMIKVEEEEREIPLISSLLGLMSYCRGVIFDTLDEQIINQSEAKLAGEMLNCLNPEDFRCPISLELMMDPVTISTGQTYDRASIEKWLNSGHLLCPKTGEKLESTELVPNSALKKIIQQFCSDNGISILKSARKSKELSRTVVSPSPASRVSMRFLAQFFAGRLHYGTDEQKNKAAYEIRLLTKSNIFNRSILIEVGNVAPLLDLLTSTHPNTQENAIAALLKLSKHSKGQKSIIQEGGLMLIISVLRRGMKVESRQIAAATIFYLSAVEKYRRLIGSTREAIPGLVDLIKDGTMCGKKNAIAAIFGLLLYHKNHERALEAGIIPTLVDLVTSIERSDLLADSLAILACLAEKIDGCIAILQTSTLPLIINFLKSSISKAGKEYCVSILSSLCTNGGPEVIAALAKEQAIMPSLYGLVTEGSAHASKKARMLINMLHKFNESSSSNLAAASKVHKERFVHAM
ncbi:U-box domain-containing protein 19 [Beta vulgaris subsp. vulgaris]|uniref:U-box domain-containing protein 19 n=1 Tax=Beta vulgaris subsp. vulgaris TaxID=3555 RepID=UPI0025494915|nr:U-box domain-containing protein 19 [Beta vulgaris subsp. vulgaris]